MRTARLALGLVAVVVSSGLLGACESSLLEGTYGPFVGTIVRIEAKNEVTHVLVGDIVEPDPSEYDHGIVLWVRPDTRILVGIGVKTYPGSLDDLRVGAKIRAYTARSATASDPPQTPAIVVIVERGFRRPGNVSESE